MIVNGKKHIPTILKYRRILDHLDNHPEDYGKYFLHKNELSPDDYEWMCIDTANVDRFDEKHR
jgi:hypothetical protein